MKEHHNSSSRYYPATAKDHGREFKKHEYCECQDEGMDTHTHGGRYVPAGGRTKFTEWVKNIDERTTSIKGNWLGINIQNK